MSSNQTLPVAPHTPGNPSKVDLDVALRAVHRVIERASLLTTPAQVNALIALALGVWVPNIHALGGASHSPSTLAALNALISDANLDAAGTPRPPIAHAPTHVDPLLDPIQYATAAQRGLMSNIAQTFAGVKTFNDLINALGGITNTAAELLLNFDAAQNAGFFGGAASGETPVLRVSGFRAADALRVWSIGVGVDFADSVSMYLDARRVMLMNLVLRNYCYGEEAGLSLSTGDSNILIGNRAGRDLTTEDNNVIIGAYAGSEIIGPGNVIIGYQAGVGVNAVSTAQDNVFIGYSAGLAITTGINNVFIGYSAGVFTTAGNQNLFLGFNAGYNNVLGNRNVFMGNQAGEGQAGLSTASDNVGIGWRSLQKYTTGGRNLALGTSALDSLTTGIRNTVAGHQAGQAVIGANFNCLFGYRAGYLLSGGSSNLLLGAYVGDNLTTGGDNIIIGYNINASAVGVNDEFRLGNINSNAVTLLWGDLANNRLGIGVAAVPTHNWEVAGDTTLGDGGTTNYHYTSPTGDTHHVGSAGMPYGEIWVKDNAAETAIGVAGTFVQFLGFTTDGSYNNTTPAHAQDHIEIDIAGDYLVTLSAHVSNVAGGLADMGSFTIAKNGGTTHYDNLHVHQRFAGGAATEQVISISGIIPNLAVNDTVEFWLTNDDNATNLLVVCCNLTILQIGGAG